MSKNNNSSVSATKLWTRILCGILAVLMVGSVAYLAIQLITESVNNAIAEKEKAESTTTKVYWHDDKDRTDLLEFLNNLYADVTFSIPDLSE